MTEPKNIEERVYLPELDGLRFLAFLLVFGFHGGLPWISGFITYATLPVFVVVSLFSVSAGEWVANLGPRVGVAVRSNGWVGVQLFFILSGYLITTLLLREEARFGWINLKAFWMRRILRIWPLYYLVLFLTFFALPALDGRIVDPWYRAMVPTQFPWFVGFLGNWSMIWFGTVGYDTVTILWSVCVEEQFYVVCPFLILLIGPRWRLVVVGLGMIAAIVARAQVASGRPEQMAIQYSTLAEFDTMLSGVALALILNRVSVRVPVPRLTGWVVFGCVVWTLSRPELGHVRVVKQVWDFVLIWLLGVVVVAWPILVDGRVRRWLASRWMVWLGRISFGLYMYHEIAFWLVGRGFRTPWGGDIPSILALGLTVGMAAASYYGFERPFLRLKRRWTRVASRPF